MASEIKVSATMSRSYGRDTITYTLDETIEIDTLLEWKETVFAAQETLQNMLFSMFEEFELHHAKNLPVPQMKGLPDAAAAKAAGKAAPIWYKAHSISKVSKGGKDFYYIKPSEGPWTKFGGAVYFDRFQGFDQSMAEKMCVKGGGYTFKPDHRVLIEVYNGKPRAIGFAHKDEIGS